jgi:hypothetical protein
MLLPATVCAGLSLSASAEAVGHSNRVLEADGIGGIHFGISETAAIQRVTKLTGTAPLHPKPTRDSACNLDASIGWGDLGIDFDHGKFVGYSYTGKRLYAWKWNGPRIGPRAIATSIDAGAVGCPAMSPLGV